jgi:uncharacterized protein (DUF58 family)
MSSPPTPPRRNDSAPRAQRGGLSGAPNSDARSSGPQANGPVLNGADGNPLSSDLMARIRRIELRTRHLVSDQFAGDYHSVFKGAGMEFDEVRPYQPGDEVRTIDWNVTARMNQPFIKRYVEARELTVMLVVDASASGNFGTAARFKRELAAEVAAVLAFAATSNNDRVGLIVFSDRIELHIPPRRGRRHILRIVRELLVFRPAGQGTNIPHALNTLNRIYRRKGIVFLISDFQADPESFRLALSMTNRRHDAIAVDLHDPLERQVADVGLIALEDAESRSTLWVDTSSRGWRRSFAERIVAHEAAKSTLFRRAGVDHIRLDTEQDYVDPLARFFQARVSRKRRAP